jgi:predicted transport protein
MKAIDRQFAKIINGTTQFVIPVFQRDYTWSEAQCDQLWRDVISVGQGEIERGHFLGSVVYVSTGDSFAGFTRWLLIDGQQRLTTLTLLLAALRDHIGSSAWTGTENGPTVRRVDNYFLKNTDEDGQRRYKLVLRRHDNDTLHAILDGAEFPNNPSGPIRENYEFFRERLTQADPEHVYRGLGRLVVVDVMLDRKADDPQLIFESLNSTGVDLTQSDLIRNFILMRLPEREQTDLYEGYWSKVETLFRGSERVFDSFMRDYLALQTQATRQEKADEIYFAFRRHFAAVESNTQSLSTVLKEILRYARYHAAFSLGVGAPARLAEPLKRLRRLVDVPAPLIMRLFECYQGAATLSENDFIAAVALLESYVFRRAICGEQTRGYWQVFATIAYRIDTEQPLTSLKVALARQADTYRYPTDEEFRKALEERDIYAKRVCFDLLARLQNEGNNEPEEVSDYSIEHIMPQNENLRPEWREMLGEDWRAVQAEWLHRLGNLTLTGYNSTYSDRPFLEKKTIPGGFAESSVRLNRFVREQDQWTKAEMEQRGKTLAARAIEIWPGLVVDQSLVDAAAHAELAALAQRRDVLKVPMTAAARALFEELRRRVRDLDATVVELAEQRTISYHAPTFFMEVLPRKYNLTLLLDLDFNELTDSSGIAQDASKYRFFVNAQHSGGVFIEVSTTADLERALPTIRLSRERARG